MTEVVDASLETASSSGVSRRNVLRAGAVGAAAVNPTWPCPNANSAFDAWRERPITGSESGSDGRCPIQRV